MVYTLTGVCKGNWSYFSRLQPTYHHYIYHDHTGRRYTCNNEGSDPGIHSFLLNGTQLAQGPTSCVRDFQVYITKEQTTLINIPSTGTMKAIHF